MTVFKAIYSNVPVWVLNYNNTGVMRRQEDGWVNATHILKVANLDKPRRTRILERDVQTGVHEKVQGGYGRYQGTWIPLERGRELAQEYNVIDAIAPLLDFTPGEDLDDLPQIRRAAKKLPTPKAKRAAKAASMPERQRGKADRQASLQVAPAPPVQPQASFQPPQRQRPLLQSFNGHSAQSSDLSSASDLGSNDEHRFGPTTPDAKAYMDRYTSSLLEFFMEPDKHEIPDFLLNPQPGFHINQLIDDDGHTVFHWTAAMGLVKVMEALIQAGAEVMPVNFAGHTPLVRAIMFTNNYHLRSFPHVLELLKSNIFYVDPNGQSVLHHIAMTTSTRSRGSCARYYLEIVLANIAELRDSQFVYQFVNKQDTNMDTALHIAARNGSRKIIKLLLNYNAVADKPNNAGRTAQEYIYEHETARRNLVSSSPPFPQPVLSRRRVAGVPIVYTSQAALAASNTAATMADWFEELATTYETHLKDRENDIEQVRALLNQVKQRVTEVQYEIPELQSQLGPEAEVNAELEQLNQIVSQKSQKLHRLVERKQARDLAQLVHEEESKVQDQLQKELQQGDFDMGKAQALALELDALQQRRQAHIAEIVELYGAAGSGERMNEYRKLVSMSSGVAVTEIDELLDGIAKALEDKQ